MGFWQRVLINAILFLAISGFFPDTLFVKSIWVALIASFVLAVLNMLVKPFLVILSLPVTVFSLGFFYLIINAFMLQMTSFFVGSEFKFSSFWAAFIISIVMSIANTIVTNYFIGNRQ